jgi:hypothetical protein
MYRVFDIMSSMVDIFGVRGSRPPAGLTDPGPGVPGALIAGGLTKEEYPLERIAAAQRYVEADHPRGNVVVTVA